MFSISFRTNVFLIIFIFLGLAQSMQAQTEILYTDFGGTPLPIEAVTTCQDSNFINQVRIEITSDDVNELYVNIDFPDGITYFPGSVNIVADGGPSIPITVVDQGFVMGAQSFRIFPDDLDVGDFFILEWGRNGNCDAIAGQQAGDFFKDAIMLNWENMGTNSDLNESIRSYDLLVGSLSLEGEGSIVTTLGASVMRELTITNGGQGELDEFTFYIIDGFGITTTQLETDDGTVITPSSMNGDTLFYTISTTEINEFGDLDNHFENGEEAILKRTYTVTECDNFSGYGAYWGCNGSICQSTTTLEQSTVIDNLIPNVDVTQINLNEDYCYNGQNSTGGGTAIVQTFQMTNSGDGEARDLFMTLNSFQPGSNTGQNYFDEGDNWVIKDQDGIVIGSATHIETFRTAKRRDAACVNADRAISVRYQLPNIEIPAGEFITLEVPTYVQDLGCITSCPSSGVSWYSFSGGWEYKDQCESNNYGNTLKRFSAKATNFKDYLIEMPTDLVDQQCFTLDVDFSRLYTRVKSSTEGFNDFIIDLTSTSLEYNGGPTITTPFGMVAVTDLGDSIVIRLPSNLSNQAGLMPVDLKANCAGQTAGAETLKFSNEVSYNGVENCSLYKHECLTNTYQMHCPAPCPRGGATPKLFTLERITYGLPDSDDNGTPDAGGSVDLNAINVHRAVNGDTVLGTWNIYVNPNVFDAVENPTDPNIGNPFNFTYVEFDLQDYPLTDCAIDNDPNHQTLFSPVPDAEVIVFPVGGGSTTCTVSAILQDDPDAPLTTNTIAKYDLSSCKATWEGGDSIVVRAKFVTNASVNNSGFNLYIADNDVYSSYVANPTGINPSDENKYTCDKFNDFMNVLNIYHSPYMPNPQDINGCSNEFEAHLRQYINVQANNVWFPNEYRSFFIQDKYTLAWPAELVFRPGSAEYQGIAIPDADVMQVGDSLIFSNLKQFYQPYGGTLLPDDEVQNHNVTWSVDPTCDAEVGAIYKAKFYGSNVGNGVNTLTTSTTAFRSCDSKYSANIDMQYDGPLPFITGGGSVQVSSDTAQWEVILNNGSNSLDGPNTWFYVNDVNGTLADFTVSQGGVEMTPDANGFFQLGDNPNGNSTEYDIEGILIGCGDSEVEVISGFNCSEYPTDINNLSCADTVLLQSTSLPSEVQVSFITQPTSPMVLCDVQNIKLRQTSSQAAYLDNPSISFIVPDGVLMPTTIDVEYPENSGNIEALTPTIIGSEWTINFEDHSEIEETGIPGTIDALTPEERSVVIDFDFNTDCDFLSGANFIFKGLGVRPCGDPADNNGVRVRTVDLDVQGANKPYTNNFMLDMPAFEGCTPTTVSADIQFVNLSAMMTSDMDSVYITLEENLEFVPGSFMCTNVDPAECLVFSYMTTDIAGDETIVLSMPPGGLDIDMPLTSSFTYQVILGNEDLCGDMKNIMYSVVTNLGDVPCADEGTGFCPSLAVTLGEQDVNIVVKKSVVTFEAATTFCNEASGVTYSGGLQISEVELLAGESLVLDVYCADAAGNAAFYTESITFNGPIAIGDVLDFSGTLSTSCNAINGVVIQASKMANGTVENCICEDESLFISGSETLECSVTINNQVLCNSESTGSATVTPEGGNGGETYLWDNTETTATATALDAGSHTVTVTDNQGCTTTCTVTLTEPVVLTCMAAQDSPVKCNGESNGVATVTPSGGNGSETYLWDNGETTATATALDAGSHTVSVTDSEGCMTTCMVTITEPVVLTCMAVQDSPVECNGESNGVATVTPSGGNGSETYLWDNGEMTATATALDAGSHTVTVTDNEGCMTTCMVIITEPIVLTCMAAQDSPVECNGESNGVATVTPSGGNGSETYLWDNGETTATATALDAGSHTVTVTDSEGCMTTCMVSITEPIALTCMASQDSPVECNGESNGVATVTPSGGNGSEIYLWDNGETTATATALDAGSHTVTVTDSEGCMTTCMVSITEPLVLACMAAQDSPVECNGESNGVATVTPSGGNGSETYLWDNGETTATATTLDAGSHTISVTDSEGCMTTCMVTITEPLALACMAAQDSPVECNGESNGVATVTPSGGNGGEMYFWDNGETTAIATTLDAGSHTVSVTDSEGCMTTCMVTITEPIALTCMASQDSPVECNGESNGVATVTPSGGNGSETYLWDNGETTATATALDAGSHTVTVTDSEGCMTTCMVSITEPLVLACMAAQDSPVECNGESNGVATVTPSGGNGSETYLWDNGETTATATALDAGSHTVTVTDSEGCMTTCMVTITEPLALACMAAQDSPVECNGESNGVATVTPSGGNGSETYLWDNGETTAIATTLDAGSHTVSVTDSEGCMTTCMVTITEPLTLTCTAAQDSPVECNGESNGVATVTPSGGNGSEIYLWDNGETTATATGLDVGSHTVTVTDSEGCMTTCMVTITEPLVLTCMAAQDSPVECNGESNGVATVTPSGGNGSETYLWDNGETTATATALDAGSHTVTVTDSEGCTTTCSTTITEPIVLTCMAAQDSPVECNGESNGVATVTAVDGNGGYTYLWDNGETTATAIALDAGTHTVTVTDNKGCITTCTATILEPLVLACTTESLLPVECNGESNGQAVVTPTGGNSEYTYLWDNGEMLATAVLLDAGTHTVTVTDSKGCTTSCDVIITEPLELTCSIGQVTNVDCNGNSTGRATVTPLGGNDSYTYLWDNGETTSNATMLDASNHTVTVTDAKGCTTTCTIGITEPDALLCSAIESDPITCNGDNDGEATVSAMGGMGSYSFLWDNGETTAITTMLTPGLHAVTVTDGNNCTSECSVTITEPLELTCTITKNSEPTCVGSDGSATVNPVGGNGGYTYIWDNNETNQTAINLVGGTRSVTVTDSRGCMTSCVIDMVDQINCLSMNKSILSIDQTDGYCYDVTYQITVENFGQAIAIYDLFDTISYDNDIEVTGVSYNSDAASFFPFALSNNGEWVLANNQSIVAGKTDTYELIVSVCLDLGDGVTGDDIYTSCGNGTGSGTMPMEGLYNNASIDNDNDGTIDETDEVCGDLPNIIHEKQGPIISVQNGDLSYDVTYTIVVENNGGATGPYDLNDIPNFEDDITINSASFTADNGLMGPLATTSGTSNVLADDQTLDAGETDTYTVTFNVTLDLTATSTDAGDNVYTSCEDGAGLGDPSAGEGLYNQSELDTNNDGTPEETDEVCGDLPNIIHEKQGPVISAQNGDLSYDVTYTIVVENNGGATGPYDLNDIPNFEDDITINSASFTADNGLMGPLATTSGTSNVLADDQTLDAGETDTYTVTFNVTLDLTATSTDAGDNVYTSCEDGAGLGDPNAGEGLYNQSELDTNNDGTPEETDEVCGDLPNIIHEKQGPVISSQNGDLSYDVTYTIVVENNGGATGPYDLNDIPNFEDDITINNASFTADNGLMGPLATTSGTSNVLADDQTLDAGETDTYTVTFNVTLDLTATSSDAGDNVYTSCEDGAGLGDPSAGEGLYNQSELDTNNDGTPEETDEVCGDLPNIIHEKQDPVISAQNGDLSYDVTYTIVVENNGGATGPYDLNDIPNFEDDITINSASFTADNGLMGPLATTSGTSNVLADDQTLAAGETDTYTVIFNVTLDLTATSTDAGDNVYTSCEDGAGLGDPNAGEGLYNQSELDTNNDGTPEETDEVCGNLPNIIHEKQGPVISSQNGDLSYDVTYTIVVENNGGATGPYDLNDIPNFEDDITINSASFTADNGLMGPLATTSGTSNVLADDQTLDAGETDTYTVTFNVTLDLTATSTDAGDNVYTSCEDGAGLGDPNAGEGLYNQSELDTNNDGTPEEIDEVCGDLPNIIHEKQDPIISDRKADGSYDISYTVLVENNGGATGPYNLNDIPNFEDDITINSASFTADNGLSGPISTVSGTSNVLANDQNLEAGSIDTYTVSFNVTLDLSGDGTDMGDNIYNECGAATSGAMSNPGEGLYNMTTLDTNNDGTPEEEDDACGDIFIFDLANIKVVAPNQDIIFGGEVEYVITVFNQGNIVANNIEVIDYLPSGISFSPNNGSEWTYNAINNTVIGLISTPINPGESMDINLLGIAGDGPDWTNISEILSSEDGDGNDTTDDDIDSTPDDSDENDNGGNIDDNTNDQIDDNGNTDEDDSDPAVIDVFDLALSKMTVGNQNLSLGETAMFEITVFNQGNLPAYNIEVIDYVNSGFEFIAAGNTGWSYDGNNATYLIEGPIVPGESFVVDLQLIVTVDANPEIEDWYNYAEIVSADDDNNPSTVSPLDFDSTPNDNPNDDNNVTPGDSNDDVTDEHGGVVVGEDEDDHDVSFVSVLVNIGDFVWHDLDGDGIQDANEPGIPGVEVLLYNENNDFIGSVFTDDDGYYIFEDVVPGTYYIIFVTPEGYESTFPNTTDDENDSDITNLIVNAGGNSTDLFEVIPGQDDFSIDAGYYICIPIGETVWYDVDTDDVEDSTENGINGMKVTLWKLHNGTWEEWDDMYTGHKPGTPSDDGYFKFCAPPGTYYVHFKLPPIGLVQAQPNVGSDLLDSDVTNGNGLGTTNTFTVSSGQEICTIGAGYYPMAEVGNFVWEDSNQNGIQEVGEAPIEGVMVQAFDLEDNMVNEVVTDQNGEYNMEYLQQESYYLKFTPPVGYGATTANAGNDDIDSDVTHAYGSNTTNAYALNSGVQVMNVDAGMAFGVLPVEWLYVKAENRGDHNLVEWATATEINSDYFEVERRVGNDPSYRTIEKVEAANNSLEVREYEYADSDISESGVYYYRIKQVDIDGRFDYSDIVSVIIEGSTTTMNLYPNPTINETMIKVTGAEAEDAQVSVFTKDGKLIRSGLVLDEVSSGNYELRLDVSTFLPGVYTVQIETTQDSWTEKLIVIR